VDGGGTVVAGLLVLVGVKYVIVLVGVFVRVLVGVLVMVMISVMSGVVVSVGVGVLLGVTIDVGIGSLEGGNSIPEDVPAVKGINSFCIACSC